MSLKELLTFKKTPHKSKPTYQKGPSVFRFNSTGMAIGRNYSNRLSYDDLINAESALGRTLFGPIPEGHEREFFESHKNVWVWHESWTAENGQPTAMTIRYEVRPNGVYKRPNGGGYERLEGAELDNFCRAVREYFSLIKAKLYC